MLLETALKYYGLKEAEGEINNPTIIDWFLKLQLPYRSDSVNWCGVFIGNCMLENKMLPPSNPQIARSYLNVGEKIPLSKIEAGDLVVFWRIAPEHWSGHVGLFINRKNDSLVNVLGGNQGDSVSIKTYEIRKLLGIRRLSF